MSSTIASNRTILVEAPETLAENFSFDITLDHEDRPYTVTVPPGGVLKGQQFEIPYPSSSDDDSSRSSTSSSGSHGKDTGTKQEDHRYAASKAVTFFQQPTNTNRSAHDKDSASASASAANLPHIQTVSSSHDDAEEEDHITSESATGAPYGRWRHNLYSCCDVVTQSTFWMALLCVPVLLAQLVTRLGLSWHGRPVSSTPLSTMSVTAFGEATEEASLSYNKLVLSFVVVLFVGNFCPGLNVILISVYVMGLLLTVGSNLRRSMRHRYKIPPTYQTMCAARSQRMRFRGTTRGSMDNESRCARMEDCCCMGFCGRCTLIQMARHTHNDKEHPGLACTTTGLEVGAPRIV